MNKEYFWIYILIVLIAFAVAVLYFGRDNPALTGQWQPSMSPESQREPRAYAVIYKSGVFSPTNLRIRVRDSVIFRNEDPDAITIASVADEKSGVAVFTGDGNIISGGAYAHTFMVSGVFDYFNTRNEGERGSIIVRP